MKLITVGTFYALIGLIFAGVAVRCARDATHPRRWGSALFWALLATLFIVGQAMPPLVVGYTLMGIVALAATGQVRPSAVPTIDRAMRLAEAARLKNGLLWPALVIPATAIVGTLVLGKVHFGDLWLIEPKQVTLISLGLGVVFALIAALRVTGASVVAPVREGGRLLEAIGWALVLPPLLAALGGIFDRAGAGKVVADLVGHALPTQFPVVAVIAYCIGMALFTMCMGNAFAAFAVITSGIGLPLIVQQHHGNPAIMAAIGMLSGYCGTLLTPMAVNFNLVPAMLLELRDPNAVIKAQVPLALVILSANILMMWICVYRF